MFFAKKENININICRKINELLAVKYVEYSKKICYYKIKQKILNKKLTRCRMIYK